MPELQRALREMSFAEKVSTLRGLFGVPADAPLPAAVQMMNIQMGISGDGAPLPKQVDELIVATGVTIDTASTAPAAPAAQVAMGIPVQGVVPAPRPPAPTARPRPAPSAGKEAQPEPKSRPAGFTKQVDIRQMGMQRLLLPKSQLKAAARSTSDARPFEVLCQEAATECQELPSERRERLGVEEQPPKAVYQCDTCGQLCFSAAGLASHQHWKHVPQAQRRILQPPPPTIFHGHLSVRLGVGTSGVSVTILVNGKSREVLQRERAEAVAKWEQSKMDRQLEQDQRAHQRQRERESEEAAMQPEQRRGSSRRRSYSATEKLEVHDFYLRIRGDATVKRKCETFENDSRSRGVKWSMAYSWNRRDIERAASQAHASSLLRIDKESRRKGTYAPMEKRLFTLFKQRRARARKCSPKWFVHTARYIMRNEFPAEASAFRGSRGWMRRFFQRFSLCRRKKTNVKNTTWEQTRPVLERYYRSYRRRLRDSHWKSAYATAIAAVRSVTAAAADELATNTPTITTTAATATAVPAAVPAAAEPTTEPAPDPSAEPADDSLTTTATAAATAVTAGAPTTAAPTTEPTIAPVAAPVAAPIAAPVGAPVAAPATTHTDAATVAPAAQPATATPPVTVPPCRCTYRSLQKARKRGDGEGRGGSAVVQAWAWQLVGQISSAPEGQCGSGTSLLCLRDGLYIRGEGRQTSCHQPARPVNVQAAVHWTGRLSTGAIATTATRRSP